MNLIWFLNLECFQTNYVFYVEAWLELRNRVKQRGPRLASCLNFLSAVLFVKYGASNIILESSIFAFHC